MPNNYSEIKTSTNEKIVDRDELVKSILIANEKVKLLEH